MSIVHIEFQNPWQTFVTVAKKENAKFHANTKSKSIRDGLQPVVQMILLNSSVFVTTLKSSIHSKAVPLYCWPNNKYDDNDPD